jgi:hypothetical protein
LLSGAERAALLVHLRECGECAGALAKVQDALLAALYLPPPRPMHPAHAVDVRERLLARIASAARGAEQGARRMPHAIGGWMVAAGLAVLVLVRHAFQRPLNVGSVVAAVLGVALFGAARYITAERHRSAVLRERLAALEAELARIRHHALATDPVIGSA